MQPKPVHRPLPALPDRSTRPKLPPLRRNEVSQSSTEEEYIEPSVEPIQEPVSKVTLSFSDQKQRQEFAHIGGPKIKDKSRVLAMALLT